MLGWEEIIFARSSSISGRGPRARLRTSARCPGKNLRKRWGFSISLGEKLGIFMLIMHRPMQKLPQSFMYYASPTVWPLYFRSWRGHLGGRFWLGKMLPRRRRHCLPSAGVSVIDHDGQASRARPVHCTLEWVDPCDYGSEGLRSRYPPPPPFTHCMRKKERTLLEK